MLRSEVGQAAPVSAENRPEQALLVLWQDLDEDARQDIQHAAEEKKRLTTVEERVAELEAVVVGGKRLA